MITNEIAKDLTVVRESIVTLSDKFKSNADIFLNESDLQSELFTLLLSAYGEKVAIQNISVWGTNAPKKTKAVYTRRLHSELCVPEGQIDLAILDLEHVRLAINSKYHFGHIQLEDGNHIFIEIKCSRTNRSSITSRNRWVGLIRKDVNKLCRYSHPCFLVCFDFSFGLDNKTIAKLQKSCSPNLELFYYTSAEADNYLAGTLRQQG